MKKTIPAGEGGGSSSSTLDTTSDVEAGCGDGHDDLLESHFLLSKSIKSVNGVHSSDVVGEGGDEDDLQKEISSTDEEDLNRMRGQKRIFIALFICRYSCLGLLVIYGILYLIMHLTRREGDVSFVQDNLETMNLAWTPTSTKHVEVEDEKKSKNESNKLSPFQSSPLPISVPKSKTLIMVRSYAPTQAQMDRIACWAAQAKRAGYQFMVSVDETSGIVKGDLKTRKRFTKA